MADVTLVIGNKRWSSWSLRPWLAMRHAGIAFDEVNIRLRRDDSKAKILAHSPAGQVPILKTTGGIVWESLAILEFLADQHPEASLWPGEIAARAHARATSAEMHAGFSAIRNEMPMSFIDRLETPDLSDQAITEISRIDDIWQTCRSDYGSGGPFLYGHFTNADAMYAPVVSRFVTYGISMSEVSQAYMAEVMALPAMEEWGDSARAEPDAP